MKIVFGLIVVGAIALTIVYFTSIESFDPTEQGKQARAAIAPGMTWLQVVSAAGEPVEYQIIRKTIKKGLDGLEREMYEPGTILDYDEQLIANDLKAGEMQYGFAFHYNFSHQVAFKVHFDGAGSVEDITDRTTMADLLDTRDN